VPLPRASLLREPFQRNVLERLGTFQRSETFQNGTIVPWNGTKRLERHGLEDLNWVLVAVASSTRSPGALAEDFSETIGEGNHLSRIVKEIMFGWFRRMFPCDGVLPR